MFSGPYEEAIDAHLDAVSMIMGGLDFVVAAPAELSVQWVFPLFNRAPIGSASVTETSYWGQPVQTCGSLLTRGSVFRGWGQQ